MDHYKVLLLELFHILEHVLFLINQETLKLCSCYANENKHLKNNFKCKLVYSVDV